MTTREELLDLLRRLLDEDVVLVLAVREEADDVEMVEEADVTLVS